MKRLKLILKIIGIALLLFVLGIFIFLYAVSTNTTPEFKDSQGKVLGNSIAKMEYVKIGGIKQFILIRGKNRNNPILLILHGGPGSPELPMYRTFNGDLENHFTVVYWDQRAAGKSAVENIPDSSFTLNQLVNDAHELTVYLKKQFKKEKIFLLGHSWGSLLGVETVYRYPDDYYAYVGTGQFGNQPKSDSLSYLFAVQKAKELNDTTALNELKNIGAYNSPAMKRTGTMNWLFTQRVYVSKFGGSIADPEASAHIFLLPILYCKEYTIGNKYQMMKNNSKSAFVNSPYSKMIPDILKVDLSKVDELKIPVYFLQGKHDYLTNFSVAKGYFDLLKAPQKEFVVFDKSAHFPSFEEPAKFDSIMINKVLKESTEYNSKIPASGASVLR